MKPIISICAGAHRIKHWTDVYNSVKANDIPFEIIFVTDKKPGKGNPDIDLPPNFKWIYSTVKPAQCYEIASRHAEGELIFWTSDVTLYNPHAFDEAYKLYKIGDYKTMIAFRMFEGRKGEMRDTTDNHFLYNRRIMPFGMMSKQFIRELGGLDILTFICGQSENDLVLRGYAAGGTVLLSNKSCIYNDYDKHEGEFNCRGPMFMHEKQLLFNLWRLDKQNNLKRTRPFVYCDDKDLLTISQGPKGLPNIYERTYIWK